MRTKKIEFQAPEGLAIPEGTGPNEDFDMVATFRVKPGGTLCLVQIGDVKLPGYDDSERGMPSYADETQAMHSAANGGGY